MKRSNDYPAAGPPIFAVKAFLAGTLLSFLATGFNAEAQSIASPVAIPTAIPVAKATTVWIRAQFVAPAGVKSPASLSLMMKGTTVDTLAGNLLPIDSTNNVYSVRIPLTIGTPGPLNMYVQTTLPGIVSGSINSAVFTINVYGASTVTHVIDPSILSGATELPDEGFGSRPVAAVADANGVVSRFIANQVIFSGTASEATAFAAKYSGKVIAQMPAANVPPSLMPMALIQIDPSQFTTNTLDTDAQKIGMRGQSKFSSDLAAQLAAFAAGQGASGQKVALNFVSESQSYLWSTTEQADQLGVSDAFSWPEFDARAWEFIAAHGITRRVKLAVIDGGFWLNSAGHPNLDSSGRSDLPTNPVQYNPLTGLANAGGSNLASCSGGSSCPWHGNRSVSVALGTLNNKSGAAGTGGQVADPILSLYDGSDFTATWGVSFAIGQNADIISMSFGEDCDDWCQGAHLIGVDGFFNSALDSGILLVASAGNNSEDATNHNFWPCAYSSGSGNGVYCVGALGSFNDAAGYFSSYNLNAAGYSNYGTTVNIWAPTNIHAMPDGGSSGQLTLHNGTSASAPYVAGVAAMVKALNPSLSPMQIKNIIGHAPFYVGEGLGAVTLTGFPNPFYPPVTVAIQPYPALVKAAGGYSLSPDVHITAPKDNAVYDPYKNPITFTAVAQDVNDGPLTSTVVWTSDVDGFMGTGSEISHDFTEAAEGVRHITVTGTNSYGIASHDEITITVKFAHVKPTPVILWPKNGMTINPGTYTVTGWANLTNPGVNLENVPCDQLIWDGSVKSTPLTGMNGDCQARLTFKAGTQKVTLSASNRLGDTGTNTITVNVKTSSDMTVVITDPPAGSSLTAWVGGDSAITLSGDAAPLLPAPANVQWSWYWYNAGSSPSTKQPIGSTSGSAGSTLSWTLSKSGLCTASSTANVVVVLQVANSSLPTLKGTGTPIQTNSGSAESNLQIQCIPQPK